MCGAAADSCDIWRLAREPERMRYGLWCTSIEVSVRIYMWRSDLARLSKCVWLAVKDTSRVYRRGAPYQQYSTTRLPLCCARRRDRLTTRRDGDGVGSLVTIHQAACVLSGILREPTPDMWRPRGAADG